jgi:hypothetical protein
MNARSPQERAESGFVEFGGINLSDWDLEQNVVASAREKKSFRYTEYHDFLSQYLLADASTVTGFSSLNLSPADKWLLMYLTDIFFDMSVVFSQDWEGWLESWRKHSEEALPGYHFIRQSPDAIDRVRLEEAWSRFRAAAS